MLLKPDRLKSFSDSVIVVAVVLLVYNLATLATTDPDAFQPQVFFATLVAYVNSFIVVFLFWVTFTILLDYIKQLDDVVISLSLIFLILVTLTPVGNVAFHQDKTTRSLVFISFVEISAGLLLILILFYVGKGKVMHNPDSRGTLLGFCVIPSVYAISLIVSIFNFTIASIIPLSIVPLFVILRLRTHQIRPNDNNSGI